MHVKSTILFSISLLLIITTEKVHAVEPITIETMIAYTLQAGDVAGLAYSYYLEKKTSRSCPSCLGTCSCKINEPDDITQRKTDCARYRQVIKEFEETLKQNKDKKEFYTGILAPIGYARYLYGYDERLKESNAQANEKIHFFRGLLRQNYCTDVED